ncbi:hypothetical protein AGMMS50249_4600 [candidate division SR1 bacterium]|nr:hypothetical protein AGMMS50249_4600 [candidate division SR1 bacterium]
MSSREIGEDICESDGISADDNWTVGVSSEDGEDVPNDGAKSKELVDTDDVVVVSSSSKFCKAVVFSDSDEDGGLMSSGGKVVDIDETGVMDGSDEGDGEYGDEDEDEFDCEEVSCEEVEEDEASLEREEGWDDKEGLVSKNCS